MIRALLCRLFHKRMTIYPRSDADGRAFYLCELGHAVRMPQWDSKPVIDKKQTTQFPPRALKRLEASDGTK